MKAQGLLLLVEEDKEGVHLELSLTILPDLIYIVWKRRFGFKYRLKVHFQVRIRVKL